jgi:hypothetical protein
MTIGSSSTGSGCLASIKIVVSVSPKGAIVVVVVVVVGATGTSVTGVLTKSVKGARVVIGGAIGIVVMAFGVGPPVGYLVVGRSGVVVTLGCTVVVVTPNISSNVSTIITGGKVVDRSLYGFVTRGVVVVGGEVTGIGDLGSTTTTYVFLTTSSTGVSNSVLYVL